MKHVADGVFYISGKLIEERNACRWGSADFYQYFDPTNDDERILITWNNVRSFAADVSIGWIDWLAYKAINDEEMKKLDREVVDAYEACSWSNPTRFATVFMDLMAEHARYIGLLK